jgi:hypothetical protein
MTSSITARDTGRSRSHGHCRSNAGLAEIDQVTGVVVRVVETAGINSSTSTQRISMGWPNRGQVSDRFDNKAIGQIGYHEIDVAWAVSVLERLARDFPADHAAVVEVLSAFIRTYTSAERLRSWLTAPADAAIAHVLALGSRGSRWRR